MKTLKQLLDVKGHEVWSVETGDTVFEAIRRMAEHGVGALLVVDGDAPAGIVSERDYARKVILEGKSSREIAVGEIMTADVIYATADLRVDSAMSLMSEKRVRHLPVKDAEGAVSGMISIGDLVRETIAAQEALIEQLKSYIEG